MERTNDSRLHRTHFSTIHTDVVISTRARSDSSTSRAHAARLPSPSAPTTTASASAHLSVDVVARVMTPLAHAYSPIASVVVVARARVTVTLDAPSASSNRTTLPSSLATSPCVHAREKGGESDADDALHDGVVARASLAGTRSRARARTVVFTVAIV